MEEAALRVRERVEQWTGISVSVGVAPTKTLAKLANYHAKKNKALTNCIKVLAKDRHIAEALQATRVSNVWGVGRAFANKLINQGITSAWELSNMPEEWAHRHMGGVTGVRLLRELKGSPSIDLDDPLTTKKMIATTRMFGEPVGDIASIREAVATYTTRAAEKLRRQHSAAGIVQCLYRQQGTGSPHRLSPWPNAQHPYHLACSHLRYPRAYQARSCTRGPLIQKR